MTEQASTNSQGENEIPEEDTDSYVNNDRVDGFTFRLLLLVVILWGINVVMIKYLTAFFPPLALAPIRLFLATCVLVPAVVGKYGLETPSRSAWVSMVGVAFFSIFIHHLTLAWGVAVTSATHAVLILGLNPLLTTLLASKLVGEPFTWVKGTGIILGFGGVALVVVGKAQGSTTLIGDMVMFTATLAAVIGYLFVKKSTAHVTPLVVTAYTHILATAALIVFGLLVNPVWYYEGAFGFWPLAILLFSSFVNTALGALWWNTGIQRIGASKASIFQNGIPVAGVFASALFLGEELNWSHLAALLLVILGVCTGTGLLNFRRIQTGWRELRL